MSNFKISVQNIFANAGSINLLKNINIEINAGDVVAILGPNGAGKSTILKIINGELKPSAGEIIFAGKNIKDYKSDELAKIRAVMHQTSEIAFDFSVREIILLARYIHKKDTPEKQEEILSKVMQMADISHLEKRQYINLSGGEKARVQLARVLAQVWDEPRGDNNEVLPRWLMLDEPTAALDWSHQINLMQTVRNWAKNNRDNEKSNIGVIAVLHDINLALRYCDKVIILNKGEVYKQGDISEVLSIDVVKEIWGVDCKIVDFGDGIIRMMV